MLWFLKYIAKLALLTLITILLTKFFYLIAGFFGYQGVMSTREYVSAPLAVTIMVVFGDLHDYYRNKK